MMDSVRNRLHPLMALRQIPHRVFGAVTWRYLPMPLMALGRIALALLLSPALHNCGTHTQNTGIGAQGGVLDLRDWNFQSDDLARLDGEWDFYPNSLLTPNDFANAGKNTVVGRDGLPLVYRAKLPSAWNGFQTAIGPMDGFGFGTYRLRILIPPGNEQWALRSAEQSTSYRIYAGGELIMQAGEVGTEAASTRPQTKPLVQAFRYSGSEIEIVLQVANFTHRKGGARHPLLFGSREAVIRHVNQLREVDAFLAGSMLLMFFHHISYFFVRRNERQPLIFALFCLLIALRSINSGELLVQELLPSLPYSVYVRLEYLGLFWGVPLCFHLVSAYFRQEAKPKLIRLFYLLAALFSLSLIFPVKWFSHTVQIYQLILVVATVIGLAILLLAWKRKRPFARLLLIGILPLLLLAGNDILYTNELIKTGFFVHYGVLFMILNLSLALAYKFSRAVNQYEDLAITLETKVIERTQQLNIEMQEKEMIYGRLRKTLETIDRDLQTARTIQEKILPPRNLILPRLEYDYAYMPLDNVGGDLLDIAEIRPGLVRVMLCDIIGHGVQAALIAMTVKAEYDDLKVAHSSPADILAGLNHCLLNKYRIWESLFPCIVVDIDIPSRLIRYASGGMHNQLLCSPKNGIQTLPRTAVILGFRTDFHSEVRQISFEPNDTLLLFSDGLTEAQSPDGKFFSEKEVGDLMTAREYGGMADLLFHILRAEAGFREGRRPKDDLTVIAIRHRQKEISDAAPLFK